MTQDSKTPAPASNALRYLRDCFESDRRTFRLIDYRRVKDRILIENEERLVNDALPFIQLFGERAESLGSRAALAAGDYELLYGSFLLLGHLEQAIVAPLVLFPAALDEELRLTLDLGAPRLNLSVLELLVPEREARDKAASSLLPIFSSGVENHTDLALLAGVLKQTTEFDTEELSLFPNLLSEKRLNALLRQKTPRCVPASVLLLVRRGISTRGVLHELDELATKPLSAPLSFALSHEKRNSESSDVDLAGTPAALSARQTEIATNAARETLSVALGPPGTGKSFTATAVALEHIARGNTVLLSAQAEQALDVLHSLLTGFLGTEEPVVRAGRGDQLKILVERLEHWLSGRVASPETPSDRELGQRLVRLTRRIESLSERFSAQLDRESRWSRILVGEGFWSKLRQPWVNWCARREPPQWEILRDVEDALEQRISVQIQLLQRRLYDRRASLVESKRKELKTLVRALRARKGQKRFEYFAAVDLDAILHAFPIWISPLSDLHHALPLSPELFDLCILDEATQADMASATPLFQRAKRALVIGDFKQLRHVSFLSRERQEALAHKAKLSPTQVSRLNYRERSVLDLCDDALETQSAIVGLDEHFRSVPPIIEFSNARFYNGALRIMTQRPVASEGALIVSSVSGTRQDSGENPDEATQLLVELKKLVDSQKSLPDSECQSIGVLSPFRQQVEHLREMIEQELPRTTQLRHQIRVSTAHGFQGEERDVMLLSWALDDDSPAGSFTFLRREDVLNMACAGN
ncbi:MAG: AAA domain-containing protein, partial [Myxococcota bacterium]